tara:strand:+ start:717 stop:938 length:222 start_codon:yes stop_codon:yes gene_type:complete
MERDMDRCIEAEQMTKLTELARAESKAWYVYSEATRVRQEAEVAEEAASFAWDYAHSGYKAELKKTQKENTND